MTEKQNLSIDRPSPADSDWPTLIERVVDDVSRILRSEGQILQSSIGNALELRIANTLTRLIVLAMMIAGASCILCSAIFLLHQWLPLWQAFGIAGFVMLIAAMICNATLRPRSESRA